MERLKKIDFAIVETLNAHPEFQNNFVVNFLKDMVSPYGIELRKFTRKNNAREIMSTVTQTDMLHFVLEEVIKCYNAIVYYYYNDPSILTLQTTAEKMAHLTTVFPYYGVFLKAVEIIANPEINAVIFYKTDYKELMALVDAVINCRYHNGSELRNFIDKAGLGHTTLSVYGTKDLFAKVAEDISKTEVAENIHINQKAANQCLLDVMSGSQLRNQHNEYGLNGTLFATQDIGKRRRNQEDAVIILEHPTNPEFKLLAVSDGMGGVDYGEKASSYTTQQLAKWFQSLPADLYYFPFEVQQLLNKKIAQISKQVYNDYNAEFNGIKSGATLAASVITQDYTINSTVGDSRIYILSNDGLQLVTKDESAVWPPYTSAKDIQDSQLDELRFMRNNNEILRCIGVDMDDSHIQTYMIENNSYDRLLIFSDGVTDLLSQEQISVISRSCPIEKVTSELVRVAISQNAVRAQGEDEKHYGEIKAGKDNATAAMYARR